MRKSDVRWSGPADAVLGTIHVDYPNRETLESDLHDFWDSVPVEGTNNDHVRVQVIVRDCMAGREFFLNKTFPFADCVAAVLVRGSDDSRARG